LTSSDLQVYDHDHYLVSNDFGSYLEAQGLVDELWGGDKDEWTKKSILTAFAMGDFSSDRSVQDYADGVSERPGWKVSS
jgi:starch phosphorylase